MAESVLDLIDVKFQDATGHTSTTSADTIGLVMPYYWGESDKVIVFNRTTFFEMFPESLPMGVKNITNTDLYSAYAQVKAAFAHGAGEVEIYRPSGGWKYQRVTVSDSGVIEGGANNTFDKQDEKFNENKAVTIALKHAGFIPQALAYGYNYVHVGVALENNPDYTDGAMIKLNVYGSGAENEYDAIATVDMYDAVSNPSGNPKTKGYYERSGEGTELSPYVYEKTNDTSVQSKTYYEAKNPKALGWYTRSGAGTAQSPYVYTLATATEPEDETYYYVKNQFTLLESFEGAASATANIGGESIYLEDVVNGNSMFIDVRVTGNVTIVSDVAETKFTCNNYDESTVYADSKFTENFKLGVDKGFRYFRDYESSICTLIINPFVSNAAQYGSEVLKTTYDAEIKSIASPLNNDSFNEPPYKP